MTLLSTVLVGGVLCALPLAAGASIEHTTDLSQNAVDYTPNMVPTTAVPHPRVDAYGMIGDQMFAGGEFDSVAQGPSTFQRVDLLSFSGLDGTVSTSFHPIITGVQVWAIATDAATNSVYVGGDFTTVNGVKRAALVKLDATSGAVDTRFTPPFHAGRVTDLQKIITSDGTTRLLVAGNMGKRLFSLNPATGVDDGYMNFAITDPIPGAWGHEAVYHFAVDPGRTHLVATGNFQKVNAQSRTRFFMLDLGATSATLDNWYYPGFAKPCTSTAPRRIAYLQGVDWSPSGDAFDITATGQISLGKENVWYQRLGSKNLPNTTVCDAVGRFNLNDYTKPAWINYTGGDSVWVVTDTGKAVYTQGHYKWMDNPDGFSSQGFGDKTSGAPAAQRRGIGAIDPATGLANSWDPGVRSAMGGKALLSTRSGLWVGNDSAHFGGEPHYGIAFAPLLP